MVEDKTLSDKIYKAEVIMTLSNKIYNAGFLSSEDVKSFINEQRVIDLRGIFTTEEWDKARMFIFKYEDALDKKIKEQAGQKLTKW